MSRKILFVIDSLGSGGAQNQLTLLATLFKKNGDEVEVFTYHQSDFFKPRLETHHIPITHSEKRTKVGMEVVAAIGGLLKQGAHDMVISFLQTPSFYVSIALRRYGLKVPLLVSERFISFEKQFSLTYWMKRYTHYKSSHATSNSHHERERIIRKRINSEVSMSTIYNMVDLEYYTAPTSAKSKMQKLLCVASVSPYKNGMCVVEAMIELKRRAKLNMSVTWIGSKVYAIPERKAYIEKMEVAIKVNDLASHWTWKEPKRDIRSEYLDHDALVHPSFREGLPNVICEALSSGLPVIASDVLDHPILLDEEKNGFLFDHQSPRDLADKIVKFYELSDEQINRISHHARSYAETHFSEDRFFQSYDRIVNQILGHA